MTDIAAPASTASADTSDSFDNDSDSFDGAPESDDNDSFDDVKPDPKTKVETKPKADTSSDKKPEKEGKKVDRFITATVNGKEVRISESQLVRDYQKYMAGDERLAAAAKAERSQAAFFEALQKDPESVLSDPRLPIDRQALALKWLKDQVEDELQDPKDKLLNEKDKKLKTYEDRERQEEERVAQEAHQKEHKETVSKIQTKLQETFTKAMELSPLAQDPETAAYALREMAIEFRLAKKSGYQASPEELAEKVQARYFKSLYSAVQHLSGADLVNFLGKDLTKKLRAYDLEQLRGPAPKDDFKPAAQSQAKPNSKQETIDPGDFRQKLRDQY